MIIFKNLKALSRIQLMVSVMFTMVFLIVSILLYLERKNRIERETGLRMDRELNELSGIINIYLKRDKDLLNMAVAAAENKINEFVEIVESENSELTVDAVDPYTNLPIKLKIKEWLIDNSSLVNNSSIVDELNNLTKVDVSIYQKSDKGYVNVSTSMQNQSDERLTGDIILNSSQISAAVGQGNQYFGRVFQRNTWYMASYKPIYIDGEIKGMYYLGIKERLGRALKEIFASRNYFKSGYSFLITRQGVLLVHPKKQGESLFNTRFFKELVADEDKKVIKYQWPENDKGNDWILHSMFHSETQSYICISYPKSELNDSLIYFLLYIFIGFLLFIILLQVIFYFAKISMQAKLRSFRIALNLLAKGHKPATLSITGDKEFMEISDRINTISLRFREMAEFANELLNDNFTQKYPASFIDDEIGEALIKINDKLNEAMYNEHIRLKEEKLRLWESEGLSKFVNILQRNRDNLDELCYEIILNLVQYLNANLGALFFINFDNPDDIYFEQMATFAYDQRKIINKKIYPEQGLIGRIYNERQTIYLTEIPDGYINVSSGLGESTPKNLIIVPLLINKEVYGAIEIASFNIIKGFQIEFIEKIGENIASTINNVLVNNKTKELLKQSRAQSDMLGMQEEEMRRNLVELKNIQNESDSELLENRSIFKSLDRSLLLAEIDNNGLIVSINDQMPALFLLEKANIIGKHYSDFSYLVAVDEYKNLIANWQLVKAGKRAQFEMKVKNGYGKMINLFVNLIPGLVNDKLTKVIIMGIELHSN